MPLTKLLSADRIGGLIWVAFGLAVVYGAWAMDRLESLGIPLATAPGVVPGLLGIAFIIFGSILLVRHEPGAGVVVQRPHLFQEWLDSTRTSAPGATAQPARSPLPTPPRSSIPAA